MQTQGFNGQPVNGASGEGIEKVAAITDPTLINAVSAKVSIAYPVGATLDEIRSAILDARNAAIREVFEQLGMV